ncbi:MAG: ABC transporter ATP-binding protein [Acidimicrobiales bacterium]
MLELDGITKTYGQSVALAGIGVTIEEGEFFSIVGPSGCGKSTLLRIVAGLDSPDEGSVSIDGVDVGGWEPVERGIGMVFQNYALFPHLTAAANIGFGLKGRISKEELRRRVAEIAELLELDAAMLQRRPRQLSGGQRQRVALGRALIRRPRVLLMDEPLSSADAPLRERMRSELKGFHHRAGTTTLYVTHDQREAMSMSDRMMVLDHGRAQQVGRPIDVYRRPATAFAARFVGSPGMSVWPMPVRAVDGRHRLVTVDGHPWPVQVPCPAGTECVLVGVRPERLGLRPCSEDSAVLHCTVDTIEPQGEQALVHASYRGHAVVAAVEAVAAEQLGAEVDLWLSANDLHLFAVDSGERLADGLDDVEGARAGSAVGR